MQRSLILLGIVLLIAGLLWPWISKMPLGRLPGDLIINKPNLKVFIPITSMIAISIIISLIIWLFRK